jgi:hypothetical protein
MVAPITNALTSDGIIPDVLPAGTVVQRNLKVSFHTTTLTRPGQMIDRQETQPKPVVFVDPPVCLLLFADSVSSAC